MRNGSVKQAISHQANTKSHLQEKEVYVCEWVYALVRMCVYVCIIMCMCDVLLVYVYVRVCVYVWKYVCVYERDCEVRYTKSHPEAKHTLYTSKSKTLENNWCVCLTVLLDMRVNILVRAGLRVCVCVRVCKCIHMCTSSSFVHGCAYLGVSIVCMCGNVSV